MLAFAALSPYSNHCKTKTSTMLILYIGNSTIRFGSTLTLLNVTIDFIKINDLILFTFPGTFCETEVFINVPTIWWFIEFVRQHLI